MTMHLTGIHRFPLKGFGEDALERVSLAPGRHLPHDREWALAHAASDWDPEVRAWAKRKNFVQTAQTPELARVATSLADGRLTLSHPDREPLMADPATEGDLIGAWAEGLAGHRQPGPYMLARLDTGALTDVADAHVSIMSDASLRALSERAGRTLERRRFRGNLWIDGGAPWEEFDWIGREIVVGSSGGTVRLRVTARIDRCAAPSASPATGGRNTAVVDILGEAYGHIDFGVYAQVVAGGDVALGDTVTLAS